MFDRLKRTLGGGQAPRGARRQPEPIYLELRERVLRVDPAEAGIAPTPRLPRVWGVLMEMGLGRGVATLVSLADGATSLYTSTGGGIIGGGERPVVAAATVRFLEGIDASLDAFAPTHDYALPNDGRTRLVVLTYTGTLAAEADSGELGEGRHELSPIFYLAQDVITELRLIDEARQAR